MDANRSVSVAPQGDISPPKPDSNTGVPRGCVLAAVILLVIPLLIAMGLANLLGDRREAASEFLEGRMVLSLWVLLVCGSIPVVLWKGCWENEGFCLAVATGAILGLLYGVMNGYWISTPFFGACVGAISGYILHLAGIARCEGWQLASGPSTAKEAAKKTAGITAAAYAVAYCLGVVTPTPLIPKEQATWRAERLERNATESRKRVAESEAANPKGKLSAFKAVVSKFKQFPDRFTPDSERTTYNEELGKLVEEFRGYQFDAKANPAIARAIVELYESKIEGNYTGHQYNLVDECVRNIYSASLDR